MREIGTALSVHFAPLLPASWLITIGLAGFFLTAFSLWKNRKGLLWRIITFGVFMLALLNPSLLEENREAVKDVASIVVDRSPSQEMGQRTERTGHALAVLKAQIERQGDMELRVIEAPASEGIVTETRLFDSLDRALSDVPERRRAGVVFLTDGQIHDVPQAEESLSRYGPVHAMITGERNEKDRQVVITEAPAYGIVGQNVRIRYKVEDHGAVKQDYARLAFKRGRETPRSLSVPVGVEQEINLPVEHAGQNVFELSAEPVPGELTESNNRATLLVNGVRDRLRVLLVSGQPHSGGRTWRDLLTSDPGVDLIHFTILREPDKLDATPQRELSLIAFPFRELFEIKLYDFDLIIFDRYRLNRILPNNYFNNIVRYVEEGGALLEASGPSFATADSVYYTSLMKVLPGIPTGDVFHKPFLPAISPEGLKHPVTRDLYWSGTPRNDKPGWGRWLRQVGLERESGETLMTGVDGRPLLILDRVGDGRVAQIASDHIWLWSRGYEGGGPHAELLRRVVHWLMKEPELDEKALDVQVSGRQITIRSWNYGNPDRTVNTIKPDGTKETVTLEEQPEGWLGASLEANQLGIHVFEDSGGQRRYAVIGELNPPELRAVRATPDILKPLVESSNGQALWLAETPEPDVRFLGESRSYGGNGWIGLRRNRDYTVTGVKDRPLLPEWLAALLLLGLITLTWWREGH